MRVGARKLSRTGLGSCESAMTKTLVDLQKRFPIYQAYSKYLAAYHCGLAITQHHDKVEITLVDWERGIVHCVLIQHL